MLMNKAQDLGAFKLFVYESGQAALEVADNTAIEFTYTDEVAEVISEIDNVTAIELFDVLNRNRL